MRTSRILTLFLLLAGLFQLSAQTRKPMINPYVDHKILHFGFSVGLHNQDLLFSHSGETYTRPASTNEPEGGKEQWFAEIPKISPGFNVGLIADLALNEYMNFRVTPSLYFGSKSVHFRDQISGTVIAQDLRSNYLSVPLLLKFNSKRLNNIRPYLIAGASLNVDLSRKTNEPLLLKPMWMGIEIGVGSTFYFSFFRFNPELKFCLGMNNILDSNRTDLTDIEMKKYSDALTKVTSRLFVLTLNFE